MSTMFRVTCRHCGTLKNALRKDFSGEFRLLRKSILVYCMNRQSNSQIHCSNFLVAGKRKEEIKQTLRDKEYVSPSKRKEVIDVWEGMTVKELGKSMGRNADYVFELMDYVADTKEYKSPHDILAWKTLVALVNKAEFRLRQARRFRKRDEKDCDVYPESASDKSKLRRRPAVVTIMGHVDHGKTTLLDYLRKSSIVASEFGGITQHIGAFSVNLKNNSITFMDTPGHAAFKTMRSRGAHCTDIVILVVAADDGVMEQTEESIRMAKDANVPIIVAINKIDKKDADVELTKKMLMIQDLVPEEFGGDIQCVAISALKGTNVDALTEAVITQAELSDLRADPNGKVEAIVIETRQNSHLGKLSTALIKQGTLRKNDILVAGLAWARVRKLLDENGNPLKEAPPSTPVEVVGWQALPNPGDIILEVESESRAREVVNYRQKKVNAQKSLEDLEIIQHKRQEFNAEMKERMKEKRRLGVRKLRPGPKQKEIQETYTGPVLNMIVRSDVEGSLEAILDCLYTYYDPLCKLDIILTEVGNVTTNDVELAATFNAVIYNFNVSVLAEAAQIAEEKSISIRPFNIIYRLLEDVKAELNSRVPPIDEEEVTAEAVVQEQFLVSEEGKKKKVPVAGCRCTKGNLSKNAKYKVIRDGVEVHRGRLVSMRNLKTEVSSIKIDQECGLRFEDSTVVFKPGDIIQSYRTYTVPQQVTWNPY